MPRNRVAPFVRFLWSEWHGMSGAKRRHSDCCVSQSRPTGENPETKKKKTHCVNYSELNMVGVAGFVRSKATA